MLNVIEKKSAGLAKLLIKEFAGSTRIQIQDLVQIGLYALVKAARGFKVGNFNGYWRKIAKNEMLEGIKEESIYYQSNGVFKDSFLDGGDESFYLSAKNEHHSEISNSLAIEEIMNFLKDPTNGISEKDLQCFLYFVSCNSYKKTASKYLTTYNTIYLRVNRVREKIANILYKSKD